MKKLILAAVAALSLMSCSVLQNMNTSRVMQGGAKVVQGLGITNEQMIDYVGQSVAQLDAQAVVLPSTNSYVKRLAKITTGLKSVNGIPLNFKVYKTSEVNAFACADGSVRVYTGLMDIMSDQEILGVIGHEVGHVGLEHTLNAYKYSLYTSAAFDVLASTGNVAAALTDTALGQIGHSMLNARYSRKQETAADDYAYDFLKAAGVNPWYMAMAFEQLEKATSATASAQQGSVMEMFSSHPDTQKRIDRVTKRCAADGFSKPVK